MFRLLSVLINFGLCLIYASWFYNLLIDFPRYFAFASIRRRQTNPMMATICFIPVNIASRNSEKKIIIDVY